MAKNAAILNPFSVSAYMGQKCYLEFDRERIALSAR